MRPDAPAARMKSPYTSVSVPNAPATMAAANTKAAMAPPESRPEITSSAPCHSTSVMAPNTRVITSAVITARRRMRRLAVSKLLSTAAPNRFASRPSWVKACTIRMAPSTSETIVPISATRSWLVRLISRTLRPSTKIGTMVSGITSSIIKVRRGLTQNI